jgi:uncharacterized protein (TIGR00255 family)
MNEIADATLTRTSHNESQPAPIYSMTGFARVTGRVSDSLAFSLSLKSVNHRFLDLHMRLPGGVEALEMRLRRAIKERVVRGHIEVTLTLERSSKAEAQYDRALVAAYIAAFRSAAREHELDCQPDLNTILRLPGVLTAETRSSAEDTLLLEEAVAAQIDAAIASLNAMRAQEGQSLVAELRGALDRLLIGIGEVAELRHDIRKVYFDRISQRLATLLNGALSSQVLDRDRILQEAAMLAERSDVEEEIARLRGHVQHFRSLLEEGGEVGKKLDFLLQEMNREANTLLSKTSGVAGKGSRITELGLGLKAEIEKAREQVQNVE